MRDGFGREIDYIRISVTDRCNLRCIYCMPAQGVPGIPHEEILTYDEIQEICQVLAGLGIHKVRLTGGEPLVRKGLPALVKRIKEIPGISKVTLTTNGCLLAGQLEDLRKAGLDGVNISIDTLNERRYREITRGGKLTDALEGFHAAVLAGAFPVKVNCVPVYGAQEEELFRIAALAKEYPVHVRFIEMMPIGLGKEFSCLKEEELLRILERVYGELKPYKGVLGNGPSHYYSVEGFQGKIGFISAISHKFCESCNRVRLTSTGFLKTCLQYSYGEDLKGILRGIPEKEQEKRQKAMEEAIRQTLLQKPLSHCFGEAGEKKEEQGMSRIGG